MKKKILALVFAGTLMCGSAFQVSAAGSVTAGDITAAPVTPEQVEQISSQVSQVATAVAGATVAFDSNTNSVKVTVEAATAVNVEIAVDDESRTTAATAVSTAAASVKAEDKVAVAQAVAQAVAAGTLKDVPADAQVIEDVVVNAINFSNPTTVTAVAEIAKAVAQHTQASIQQVTSTNASNKVTSVKTAVVEISSQTSTKGIVTLSVSALSSSISIDTTKVSAGTQRVYALHYSTKTNGVEKLACTITNGVLGFYMKDFSPVAIVVEEVELVPVGEDVPPANNDNNESDQGNTDTSTSTPAATDTTPTSPKTADAAVAAVVLVAMMGIAGIAVFQKKIRA